MDGIEFSHRSMTLHRYDELFSLVFLFEVMYPMEQLLF